MNLKDLSARLRKLEFLLWILAGVVGIGAFLYVVPRLSTPTTATATPTGLLVSTLQPTLTPLPTATPTAPVPPLVRSFPAPRPTPPSNAQEFVFAADRRRSGWIASKESKPHLDDRNLHAGTYRGQTFKSLLYFDLSAMLPDSRVLFAELEITGLNRGNLGPSGIWTMYLWPFDVEPGWGAYSYADLADAQMLGSVGMRLEPQDLGEGQVNQFVLSADQRASLERALDEKAFVGFRLDGPSAGESLFTWDGGDRDPTVGSHPTLRVIAVPGKFTFITLTPTPQNVLTAAVEVATARAMEQRYGTPTLLAHKYATPLPPIPVTAQPTPANELTATAYPAYITAVAMTTGTFTPTPPNLATVTPTPQNTATPPFLSLSQFTPQPTPTPSERSILDYRTLRIPPDTGLIGQIAFLTNREGNQQVWVMDSNGKMVGKLLGNEYHTIASVHDLYSPDWRFHLDFGHDFLRRWTVVTYDVDNRSFAALIQDPGEKGIGAYHPAWSPTGTKVAFVSERTGYSEIYVLDLVTKSTKRLTDGSVPDGALGYPPFFKHPSWSPDGSQIVFFSDRGTNPPRRQIWLMNADGTNMRNLSPSPFDDWDPVWIKR